MTGLRKVLGFMALLTAVTLLALPALAKGRDDPAFHRGLNIIDLHVRYPGDVAYSFGTTRPGDPDKGPYVERCTWSAGTTLWVLPFGLTQSCIRYTEENTN
jgi:hypothetical protein